MRSNPISEALEEELTRRADGAERERREVLEAKLDRLNLLARNLLIAIDNYSPISFGQPEDDLRAALDENID